MDPEGYITIHKPLSKHNPKGPTKSKKADKIQNGRQEIKSAKIHSNQVKSPIIAQPGSLFQLSKLHVASATGNLVNVITARFKM